MTRTPAPRLGPRPATRLYLATLLAVVSSTAMLAGAARAAEAPCPSTTDARGDQTRESFNAFGNQVAVPASESLDITSASLYDTPGALNVALKVAALTAPSASSGGGYGYAVRFTSRIGAFRVMARDLVDGQSFGISPETSQPYVDTSGPADGPSVTGRIDYASSTIHMRVPLTAVTDGKDRLHATDVLSKLAVRTDSLTGSSAAFNTSFADYAGFGDQHLRLAACSNGKRLR